MCASKPRRVIAVMTDNNEAVIELDDGGTRTVSTMLLTEPVHIGVYVIVHSGGFVLAIVDQNEARETLALISSLTGIPSVQTSAN